MDTAKKQIVDAVKSTENILVTVSNNPTVDELSAALGLTVILNNLDKRASSVFSGMIPPAITFLEPKKTFEQSAESLRDFIIALDKQKADHLRYKVEGDIVKIFITPYKRVLTEKDLEFSQGDYNVELVIALGVTDQAHLDKALEAQGKILHSATVVTITTGKEASTLGSLDWHDEKASSLSEMVVSLTDDLKGEQPIFDKQIATALLTGIVSATERFSNEKTTSKSMTMAAQLMAAGANQQLIAAKLEEAHDIAPGSPVIGGNIKNAASKSSENVLTIDRSETAKEQNVAIQPANNGSNNQEAGVSLPGVPQNEKPIVDEEKKQQDLEKQLQGLVAPPSTSVADIEKQLVEAAQKTAQPSQTIENQPIPDSPQASTSGAAINSPSIQSTAPPLPTEVPIQAVQQPVPQPTPTTASSPGIVMHHGSYSAPSHPPVINATMADQFEGETPTVDPFGASNTESGENMKDRVDVQPLSPASPVPMSASIPELPPLPPLPGGTDFPPLPPPPPLPPVLGQAPTTKLSGAVAGDIFGDETVANESLADTAQVNPPSGPGQFRIPGNAV